MIRVSDARYIGGHILWVRFNDGVAGEIDLGADLDGPVFEPLKDPQFFAAFVVDPEVHTVVWPNGADFAPEFLYERVRA